MPELAHAGIRLIEIMPIADYPTGPGFVTKDTAASVIELSKLGKRRMQTSELPGKIHIRPRNFGRLLFQTWIANYQDGKWPHGHALF